MQGIWDLSLFLRAAAIVPHLVKGRNTGYRVDPFPGSLLVGCLDFEHFGLIWSL